MPQIAEEGNVGALETAVDSNNQKRPSKKGKMGWIIGIFMVAIIVFLITFALAFEISGNGNGNSGSMSEREAYCIISKDQTVKISTRSYCLDIMEQYFGMGYSAVSAHDGVVELGHRDTDPNICRGQC